MSVFVLCKQKTAYEMRMSDWSSDVCSSDLRGTLSALMEVEQLAQAQTLESEFIASASDPIGQGDLTLTTSKGSFVVAIDASNDSLDGLARAINEERKSTRPNSSH